MALGIGLAGFMDGYQKGVGIRNDQEDRKRLRAGEDEDLAYQQSERDFATSERDRQVGRRDKIDDISDSARAEFQQGVEQGKYEADEFEKFWRKYALPKMQQELLLQGDTEGAQKLMEWGESKATIAGGKLFSSALIKSQTGDFSGALDDVITAGKQQGYIAGDFDIGEKEEILSPDGTLLGYRLTITDSEGNVLDQDIALDDIPNMISTFANPQAAWQSQRDAAIKKAERQTEMEDFKSKENIKADAKTDPRGDAVKSLRERMAPDPLKPDAPQGFDDLPRDEKDRLIEEEMSLVEGRTSTAPAQRETVVDNRTGKEIPRPESAPPPPQKMVGLGIQDPAQVAPKTTGGNGGENPKEAAIAKVRNLISQGGDPQLAAGTLSRAGIAPSEVPQDLRDPLNGIVW